MDNAGQDQAASIVDVLTGLGGGRFVEEATAQLKTLVKEMNRVAESGGGKPKGKIVITLALGLDRGIFDLEPTVQVKPPSTVRARTIMYSGVDGRLSKNAPPSNQHQLPLSEAKDVSTRSDVRSVDFRRAAANDV